MCCFFHQQLIPKRYNNLLTWEKTFFFSPNKVLYPVVSVLSASVIVWSFEWQCYVGLMPSIHRYTVYTTNHVVYIDLYDRLCLGTCVMTSASMLATQTLKLAVGGKCSLCIQTAASNLSQYRTLLVIPNYLFSSGSFVMRDAV